MIQYLKAPLLAASVAVLATVAVPVYAPASAADATDPLALPSPQDMLKAQEGALQKNRLADVEARLIKPLLKMYGPDKFGIEALYAKMLELRSRVEKGEDIGLELSKLKADAELARQRATTEWKSESHNQAMLAKQRDDLAYLEDKWIAPGARMHGSKYGFEELYNRLKDMKQRAANGEDLAIEIGKLKADAEAAGAQSWEDQKRRSGTK